MKFGPREIIFIALLICIPMAAWRLAFQPQNARCEEMQKQTEAKQAKLRELNRATGTIGDLRQRIEKLQNAMTFFKSKLPSEKEIEKVLEEIWKLAEANQLRSKSIRTDNRTKVAPVGLGGMTHCEQPVAVELEGNFLGFYSFLQALENQPRIMRIQKMLLKKPRKGPEGEMEVKFTMTIFFEGTGKNRS